MNAWMKRALHCASARRSISIGVSGLRELNVSRRNRFKEARMTSDDSPTFVADHRFVMASRISFSSASSDRKSVV